MRAAIALLGGMMLTGCAGSHTPANYSPEEERYRSLAHDVFVETNRLRTNPKAFIGVLNDVIGRMTGNIYYPLDGSVGIVTSEGAAAVNEAIALLGKQQPLPRLEWSEELAELARAHVADTGAKGLTGHSSSTGRGFVERVSSVMDSAGYSYSAENLSYGYGNGRDVVAQLVIDDGVPGRGHRKNILTQQLNYSGVGCGFHRQYRHMCVAIYAYRK